MKKISIFIISILFAAIPAVAKDYLYFGGNYSNIIGNNFINHAIGGNISAIGDYGGLKRLYVSIGFIGDVSGNRNINTYELKNTLYKIYFKFLTDDVIVSEDVIEKLNSILKSLKNVKEGLKNNYGFETVIIDLREA